MELFINGLISAPVKVQEWMSNYNYQFYLDVIIYYSLILMRFSLISVIKRNPARNMYYKVYYNIVYWLQK